VRTAKRRAVSSTAIDRFILNSMRLGFDPPTSQPTYPKDAKAASVISIDFDHLTRSSKSDATHWIPEKSEALLLRNRVGTKELIALSERYSVPMTWAICGETAEDDPRSYQRILDSTSLQEVGVHTYGHIDVSGSSESELETDIEKCLEVLKLPERPSTFIFPWNRDGHFELLTKLGFRAYRDKKRVVGAPRIEHGMINIPPTYYVDQKSFGAEGLMVQYLELCISWNSVFHLWLHPWSVTPEGSESTAKTFVEKTLAPLFSHMDKKRSEGVLSLCTMRDLSATFAESEKKTNTLDY